MVLRAVKNKTGVVFEPWEVQACHPLGKKQEAGGDSEGVRGQVKVQPTSWVVRVWNRRPDTAWEALKAGLKNSQDFNRNVNLNVNYMLTPKRGKLAQHVRELRFKLQQDNKLREHEVIFRYNHES